MKQAITLSAKDKTNPTLTVNNPASTTIADGGTTTITVTSNVAGKLTLTTASGTGWSATSSSASTAATTHTITVNNLTSTTTAGTIASGGIIATFTPTDTTNYNTLTGQSVLKQAITLSAGQTTTKYVYAGQTDPRTTGFTWDSITHNGTSVLKQEVTSKVQVNIGLSSSRDYWYIAVPNDLGYEMYDQYGSANVESLMDHTTHTIEGITYKVYVTAVKSAALNQVVK